MSNFAYFPFVRTTTEPSHTGSGHTQFRTSACPRDARARSCGGERACARSSDQIGGALRAPAAPPQCLHRQVVATHVVENDHVERRRRRALLGVAADVEAIRSDPTVQQLVEGPRVTVPCDHDVDVLGEQASEVLVGAPVWVDVGWAIDIRSTTLTTRTRRSEPGRGAEPRPRGSPRSARPRRMRARCRGRRRPLRVRSSRAGPVPHGGAGPDVLAGLVEGEVLRMRLLVDHDQIHAVPRGEHVLRHHQERVGVRWQIDAGDAARQREHRVDQAGPWCENPLWSLRQHVEVSRMFRLATGARQSSDRPARATWCAGWSWKHSPSRRPRTSRTARAVR